MEVKVQLPKVDQQIRESKARGEDQAQIKICTAIMNVNENENIHEMAVAARQGSQQEALQQGPGCTQEQS